MRLQPISRFVGSFFRGKMPEALRPAVFPEAAPPPTYPSSFASARSAHPVFSKMDAAFAIPRASFPRTARFESARQAGFGSRAPRARSAPVLVTDPWLDQPSMHTVQAPTPLQSPTPLHTMFERASLDTGLNLAAAADRMAAQFDAALSQMLRSATQAYLHNMARIAAMRPPAARARRCSQSQTAQPAQQQRPAQQYGSAGPQSARTAPSTTQMAAENPALSIKLRRDSAGWSAYLQELKTTHGWSDAHVARWVVDFKNYIKFGDEKAADAFNRKYARILQAKVEDGDSRANFVKLLKTMEKSLKAAAPKVAPEAAQA